ncbi:MAG: GntR family transcriptional regulator [Spirochaetales bacterium]|nr:GntR family transcriptional regulator [Spirochaetales bacterium]
MANAGSLKKKIYQQIFQKIINNEFPLDEFLVEGKLAEMFGVSRAPVREALVELCNEKILRNIPRAGYQIVQLSQKELRDALQLRLILETEGMKMACGRLNDGSVARLKALKKELRELENGEVISLESWMTSGSHLHLTIAELSGNQLLYEKIQETHNIIRRATVQIYLNQDYPRREQPLLHERIVNAMIRGDKGKAVELLRKDINTLREILQEA